MASSSSGVRSWRTAFLTLRDETLTTPLPAAALSLLRRLVLSHSSEEFVCAAAELTVGEVTSDVIVLVELALDASKCENSADAVIRICHLIHDISCRVRLEMSSSSWPIVLNFCEKILECSAGLAENSSCSVVGMTKVNVISEILNILRLNLREHGMSSSSSDSRQLLRLLLCLISCLHVELVSIYHPSDVHWPATDTRKKQPKCNSLWEMYITVFSIIGDVLPRLESSISENLWQSLVEGLRKVIDFLSSKNLIMEDNIMSRFYASVLRILHLVLANPKGSLSGHVTGFVAALQMFFTYGLSSRCSVTPGASGPKEFSSPNLKHAPRESSESGCGPYRPPHLRSRGRRTMCQPNSPSSSDCEPSTYNFSSSDSDVSDNDGCGKDGDRYRSSKVREAAIICIQDICHADPKSLTSLWTCLLPDSDVLQPRRNQSTLMTCLLFDPVSKIRMASASTLAAMLEGHSLVFLQVAELKEHSKCGSFTTLSSSLGQILMQLHRGLLYSIQHEVHSGLLASVFKVLMLLISSTPYSRMPGELLPSVIVSLHYRIKENLASRVESSYLGNALSCLGAALSRSPPSLQLQRILEEGLHEVQEKPSVAALLIQLSEQGKHPIIMFEALQALKALSHNYPSTVSTLWDGIFAVVFRLLQMPMSDEFGIEAFSASRRGDSSKNVGPNTERCVMAAIKLLDECLRAVSGFKGTDDLQESKLQEFQVLSDFSRRKKISSSPYNFDRVEVFKGSTTDCSGCKQWHEVIEKQLPLALSHSSSLVRAASITCFAGMTSSVFFSFTEEKQEFIISSVVSAALSEGVPSVRSAACRAIGVVTSFKRIIDSKRVLNKFIHAIEFNTHDPLTTVRITASWALANICDSLRHKATDMHLESCADQVADWNTISILVESALRLAKDGDKVKSNAVRALGNLSRFIRFMYYSKSEGESKHSKDSAKHAQVAENLPNIANKASCGSESPSCGSKSKQNTDTEWLERMVQAFVSCVTTGNVKVQWNVCYALGNLFMNDTLDLRDMSWAPAVYSILLLLLRDSTNFKIRIHAAVALAVPSSRLDYGCSFSDVVHGVVHVLESLHSDQVSMPSGFRYKDILEKQVTLTTLHLVGFASSEDDQVLMDFFSRKAAFLEDWLKMLCTSERATDDHPSTSGMTTFEYQENRLNPIVPKKVVLQQAIEALLSIYKYSNHQNIAQRFEKLADMLR